MHGAGEKPLSPEGGGGVGGTAPIIEPDLWKPTEEPMDETIKEQLGKIVGILQTIGIVVSVVTLSIIGLKFMLGSVEEKAQYKQTLAPWLVGAILIFALTTVPSLIYNIVQAIF